MKNKDNHPLHHPNHIESEAGRPTGADRSKRVAAAFKIETNDEGATSLPPPESVHTETGLVHRPGLDVTRKEKTVSRRPIRNRD